MAKARLYLDVDGRINLFGMSTWPGGLREGSVTLQHDGFGQVIESGGWAVSRNPTYVINWAPGMIDELNKLDVELVWLTTWCDNAPELIAPLVGLTLPSRVVKPLSGRVTFPSIEWKISALEADLYGFDGKSIWVEDEFTHFYHSGLGLRVQPDPNFGVRQWEMEAIKAYLEGK
jgi:hypothetical protein